MSSLSNLPYGEILDYWYEKLAGKKFRKRFIATKFVETFSFKSQSGKNQITADYSPFPEPQKSTLTEDAKLAIVIPVFVKSSKDTNDLNNLIVSIKSQTVKPTSVILVDDCSPMKYNVDEEIIIHRFNKNCGPAKARNSGKMKALETGAEIIAFTDTDCILSENWVETILKTFSKKPQFQILSGNTISHDKNWFGMYHNINGTLNGRRLKDDNRLLYGTTANLAITKDVAETIDFNENFPLSAGEDIEFCFNANHKGFAIGHIPKMVVHHHYGYTRNIFKSLRLFSKQFQKYGKGERILLQEIPNYYCYFHRTMEIPSVSHW